MDVYSHQDIEQCDSIEVEDVYDDSVILDWYFDLGEDDINGQVYNLLTFIDE
jgi:hypothetical protein